MVSLLEKVFFPSKYIEHQHGENYLIINFDNSRCRKMSQNEYVMFCNIKEATDNHNNKKTIISMTDKELKYRNFMLQLIMSGLVALKPFVRTNSDDIGGYPISVYWGVTDDCNFRCKYCYANCGTIKDVKPKGHLSKSEYRKIVNKIKDFGYKELVFTGGEPLLNSDIFEMASYAKEMELYCGLLTNGSLISDVEIDNFKIFDYIKISLDSNHRDVNDQLRGKGSYDKVIKAMELLRKNEINFDVGTVITKYNKDGIGDLISRMGNEYGVRDHTISNHIPLGRGRENDMSCSFDEVKKCDDVILKSKLKLHQNGLYSIIKDFFFPEGNKVCCGMGMSEIYINSKGDVYPCRMTYEPDYYLGNLISEELNDILENMVPLMNKIHVDNLEGCKECDYRYLCGGGCRMYHKSYSGSIYKNHQPICEAYKRQLISLLLFKNNMISIE